MSVDKLVDSTQLDADLTTVANAIRTKGGTSAQLSFPSGMAQAIADLPSGGSRLEITLPARTNNRFSIGGCQFNVDEIYVDASNFVITYNYYFYLCADGVDRIIFKPSQSTTTFCLLFQRDNPIQSPKTIQIVGSTENVVIWDYWIRNADRLEYITGDPLDLTAWDGRNNGLFYGNENTPLKEIRIVPSTIKYSFELACGISYGVQSHLSDESLISIGNALDETASSQSIKLSGCVWYQYTPRCNAIIGRNDNGTFVADPSGDMNLTNFITNVKGWTVT